MAKKFIKALKEKWLTPKQVLEKAKPFLGDQAQTVILGRLRGGRISTWALTWSIQQGDMPVEAHHEPAKLPADLWNGLADEMFWGHGDAKFYSANYSIASLGTTTWAYDVRFDPDEINAMFPIPDRPIVAMVGKMGGGGTIEQQVPSRPTGLRATTGPDIPPMPAPRHAGGAPLKAFWDRLWADIGARLYVGDLKPQKQADIEKAMLDWASANGEDLSEQSARTRARLIWKAIKEKDKN